MRVEFKFELAIPKDKQQIPLMNYSSGEEGGDDNEDEDEPYQEEMEMNDQEAFNES